MKSQSKKVTSSKASRKGSKVPVQATSQEVTTAAGAAPAQVPANEAPRTEPSAAPEQGTTAQAPANEAPRTEVVPTTPGEVPPKAEVSVQATSSGVTVAIPAQATAKEVRKTLSGILAAYGIAAKGRSAKATSKASVKSSQPRSGIPALGGVSVRAYSHRRILEGASDDALRAELTSKVGLPKEHSHYPRWYRNELTRNGHLNQVVKSVTLEGQPAKVTTYEVTKKGAAYLQTLTGSPAPAAPAKGAATTAPEQGASK